MEKPIPYTDSYFVRTRKIIQEKGDSNVTYAIFMRRPVTYAPKIAIDWIKKIISDARFRVEALKVVDSVRVKSAFTICGSSNEPIPIEDLMLPGI